MAVVVAWTGPWSPLPRIVAFATSITAQGSLGIPVKIAFAWAPFIAGTAALVAWLLILGYLLPFGRQVTGLGRSSWLGAPAEQVPR